MTPHGNAHEEHDALPGGLLDADQLTPGGPDKTTAALPEEFVERLREQAERDGMTLLPGRTREEADAARASLAALRGWAARRERFADDRADLMAAAWWSGIRTITDLAGAAGVSRDTAYADLRARGIEPKDKTAAASRIPRYAPLTAEALHELAALSTTVISPALLTDAPDPLVQAAWAVSAALERMADLLALDAGEDPGTHPSFAWGRAGLAFDLAERLRTALHHAHSVAADDISRDQLAARTLNRLMNLAADGQALHNAVSIDLYWPDDDRATVRIEHADFKDDTPTGWTLLRSNRPSPELTGAQHLAIQNALETLAAILGAHLRTDATTETDGAIS